MRFQTETGVILILVLILLSAISLLARHLLAQAVLGTRTSGSLQTQIYNAVDAENALRAAEIETELHPDRHLKNRVAFVPDHLGFGCREGVDIFKVQASGLESFVVLRSTLGRNYTPEMWQGLQGSDNPKIIDRLSLGSGGSFQSFELWETDESGKGVLLQTQGSSVFHLPFSVERGFLSSAEIFYAGALHTVLVLSASAPENQQSLLWVFDISNPHKALEPLVIDTPEDFQITTRAEVLRFKDGHVGVLVGGSLDQQGALRVVFLNVRRDSINMKVGGQALVFISAVDLTQPSAERLHESFVERLYVADAHRLWFVELLSLPEVYFNTEKSLSEEIQLASAPLILNDPMEAGVQIYFVGSVLDQMGLRRGLWSLRDPLKPGKLGSPVSVLSGDYSAVLARFGRLFLIPRQQGVAPKVINLPNSVELPVLWQPLVSKESIFLESASSDSMVQSSTIMWDPSAQCEVIYLIRNAFQAELWTAVTHRDKYGRNAWRKTMQTK